MDKKRIQKLAGINEAREAEFQSAIDLLKGVESRPPRQDATQSQLEDLIPIANRLGLVDAADYLGLVLKNQFKKIPVTEAAQPEDFVLHGKNRMPLKKLLTDFIEFVDETDEDDDPDYYRKKREFALKLASAL